MKTILLVCLSLVARFALADSTGVASCHAGAYRSSSGDLLTLIPDPDEEGSLRFYLVNGETGLLRPIANGRYLAGPGWSEREPIVATAELGRCGESNMRFHLIGTTSRNWRKIPLTATKVRFQNAGAELSGELIRELAEIRYIGVRAASPARQNTPTIPTVPWMTDLPGIKDDIVGFL